jgi:NTE family protein
MSIFGFGRKSEGSKEFVLGEIPIFSALTVSEQKLIEKTARLVEFKRGDIVYRENDPSDAFYVVISGRFRLFREASVNFPEETLLFFYRGDHFGETSLLTNRSHSASVEAKSDGMILKLAKDDFMKFVNNIPTLSLHLSRSMGHRLTQTKDTEGHREVKTVALYSSAKSENALTIWFDLSKRLFHETKRKVVLVDFADPPTVFAQGFFQNEDSLVSFDLTNMDPANEDDLQRALLLSVCGFHYLHVQKTDGQEDYEKRIRTLITFLTYRFNYLLLRMPPEIGHVTFKVLNKSDMVYAYCQPSMAHLEECSHALAEFQQGFGFSKSEMRVIVSEDVATPALPYEKKEDVLNIPIFALLPSPEKKPERYDFVIRYLARELAGKLIGLALGSGAAHGLAHIGVLKALEKEGVHVDVVAGSSIGALIGALWASGLKAEEIEKIAKSVDKKSAFFKIIGFGDLAFPLNGFIKGKQVCRFLKLYFEGKTFQDFAMPCKVVATDMFTAEAIVLDTGDVTEAVRASIAIPGIFEPLYHRGRFLIDGGVIDPMPVRVLAQMGIKKIIAVNVLQGPKELRERNRIRTDDVRRWRESSENKNLFQRVIDSAFFKTPKAYAPHIFNAIMNTIQFMEYEIAEWWGTQADIVIHPVLKDAHWAEFYSPDKFIRKGEEMTREQIEEIRRLIAE